MSGETADMTSERCYVVKLKARNGIVEAGCGRRTRINTLLGFNGLSGSGQELQKLQTIARLDRKPDMVTDLSTVKTARSDALWYRVVQETEFVAGTVPVYAAGGKGRTLDASELLEIIIEQMEHGVGLITIHPTANRELYLESRRRMVPVTSRGGGRVLMDLLAKDFAEENVYLRILPQVVSYARKHGVTLSLGATFRSANIFDSYDIAQRMEIEAQLAFAERIAGEGVGVIVESPGHARPRDILRITERLKQAGFPVMPLGPIPTDAAAGMDHVSSAIGATLMGMEGCAQILSAVTRDEHTGGIPSVESVLESIRTAQIAAHIIDMHRLDDTDEDLMIAMERSRFHTCIAGKETEMCDRCQDMCPLMMK